MKANRYAEMPDEKLIQNEKTGKVILYMLGGVLVVLFGAVGYATVLNGFTALSVMPVTFFPTIILSVVNLKSIQKEKKLRGLK